MRANQLHPGYYPAASRGHAAFDMVRATARHLAAIWRLLRQRRRERRELARFARLDDRMLRDIGLTRESAEFLINKSFWRE